MAVENIATKVDFKKYEYEDIRTEYKSFTTAYAGEKPILSRTIVKIANNIVAKQTTEKGSTSTDPTASDISAAHTTNITAVSSGNAYVLAEDVKKGDLGFVYYIIDDTSNLNATRA